MSSSHGVRRAVASDADVVFALLHELGYRTLEQAAHERAFALVTAHPEMYVFLAEDSRRSVVGLLALSHRPQLRIGGTLVTIDELVVKPDCRGTGIGRALLDRAKQLSIELGAARLELLTNRTRESYGRGFYGKNGFVEVNSAVMRHGPV